MGSEKGTEAGLSQHMVAYIRKRCRPLQLSAWRVGGFSSPALLQGAPCRIKGGGPGMRAQSSAFPPHMESSFELGTREASMGSSPSFL